MATAMNCVVLFCLLSIWLHVYAITVPTLAQPWPMPSKFEQNSTVVMLHLEDFAFTSVGGVDCDILEQAYERYRHLLNLNNLGGGFSQPKRSSELRFASEHGATPKVLTKMAVEVKTPCSGGIYPSENSDESYELIVFNGTGRIRAKEVWGALRALLTFTQLTHSYEYSNVHFIMNETYIQDSPRFSHRGLLLDTSRHFINPASISNILVGMEHNKLNVFHWHIVDDQSFPYISEAFPDLSKKGGYGGGGYYHSYDAKHITGFLESARVRGIRVIPEFGTPGHTQSWGKALPEFLTECYEKGKFTGKYGPVTPVFNATYDILFQFFRKVVTRFPDHSIHLGGDSVDTTCWETNPNVTEFMMKMKFDKNYTKLEDFYFQRLFSMIGQFNKGYHIWQDVIDSGITVDPDTLVHVWKDGWENEMSKVTKLGHKTVLSSCWDLSLSAIRDWEKTYLCDPQNFTGTDDQKALVKGGEAAIWGEFIDNSVVSTTTWPRASLVAERLWSPASVNSVTEAIPRLAEHRCRMISLGIAVQDIFGPGFCPTEFGSYN